MAPEAADAHSHQAQQTAHRHDRERQRTPQQGGVDEEGHKRSHGHRLRQGHRVVQARVAPAPPVHAERQVAGQVQQRQDGRNQGEELHPPFGRLAIVTQPQGNGERSRDDERVGQQKQGQHLEPPRAQPSLREGAHGAVVLKVVIGQ